MIAISAENRQTKVLLLTPPAGIWKDQVEAPGNSTQPLGLAYVAAAVRNAGFPVELVDAYSQGLSTSQLRDLISTTRPAAVGISSLTPQWPDTERVAQIAKSVDPDIRVIVGGPHVTALPADTAACPSVDIAIVGEGELSMPETLEALFCGGDLDRVAGIAIGTNGNVRLTQARPLNDELDALAFPAHDLLPPVTFYNPFPSWGKKGHFSCIISGRGCPYNCCFCDVTTQQGRRYRLRSAENVVDEMVWLNRSFGVSMYSFRDPSMICNRRRLMEMVQLMEKNNLDIAWTCNARANEIDPEMLGAMRRAGCRRLQFGVEVGNAEMLQQIKKISRERIAQAVNDTRRAGIFAHGYFLFGFVDETRETIAETIAFARELNLDSASFSVMVPFPGTQEFERYRQQGLLLTEDWREYSILGRPVYRHRHLTNEELFHAPRRAYRRFYLRPRIVAAHLGRMLSSSWAAKEYFRAAVRVLR